jgi:transcriptional regulator with XRE-family HTH domain
MERLNMAELAERIRQRRAGKGIREAAKEIGVSPATLSRVENEKIPDLETFGRICEWLGDDPSTYLGIRSHTANTARAQVHFKKETAISQETAKALGEMIMLAQQAMLREEELQG